MGQAEQHIARGGFCIRGELEVVLRYAHTGRPFAVYRQGNKIVNVGLDLVRDLMANSNFAPSHIAVGTGVGVPVAGDTQLGTEVFRNGITVRKIDPQKITYQLFLASGDANGNTLSEAGVFNSQIASAGDMLSRVLVVPTIIKTAAITATLSWIFTLTEA